MKKMIVAVILLSSLTACNPDSTAKKQTDSKHAENSSSVQQTEKDRNEQNKPHAAQEHELTVEEVIAEVKKQLTTSVPIKLPRTLSVKEGYHLTAKTASEENSYQITFMQTKEVIPINNAKLNQLGEDSVLVTLSGQLYESNEAAAEQISYQNFEASGGETVDLGHSIKGYQDAGAGSVFLSWNEGRWAFSSRARTEAPDTLVPVSKKIVDYLERNTLPAPHQYGSGRFDTTDETSRNQFLIWQEERTVYKIENAEGAIKTLEIAVSMSGV